MDIRTTVCLFLIIIFTTGISQPTFASHLPAEPVDLSGFPERVDSKCDLVYLLNKLPGGMLTPGEDFADEYTKLTLEHGKKIEETPWNTEEINTEFLQKAEKLETDSIMKKYSIDPKLRSTVSKISGIISGFDENALRNLILLKPEQYAEDIECGKKLKADYFDQIYDIYQAFYGKEAADKIGPAIDKAITEAEKNPLSNFQSNGSGGCLIATATYGSELATQVQQLREIRDNTLLQTTSGSIFMKGFNEFYYSFSPTIADWERQNPAFKEFVKITITPLLTTLSVLNHAEIDSEEEMLGYGISLILLNVGMYFVAPAVIIRMVKNKKSI